MPAIRRRYSPGAKPYSRDLISLRLQAVQRSSRGSTMPAIRRRYSPGAEPRSRDLISLRLQAVQRFPHSSYPSPFPEWLVREPLSSYITSP